MPVLCPNDHTPMLETTLRQVRLVAQLREDAGFFGASGSLLQPMTCPLCGLTQLYAQPPLEPTRPETDESREKP